MPDNETITSDVSQGTTDLGIINHYYYYRLQAEVGKGAVHAKIAYFAPHDPGYVEDISGAAMLEVVQAPGRRPEVPGLHHQRRRARRVLAHSDSFEYPIHPGVAANPELTPLAASCSPTSFTPGRARHRPRRQEAAPRSRADLGAARSVTDSATGPARQAPTGRAGSRRRRRRGRRPWSLSASLIALVAAARRSVSLALDARGAGWAEIQRGAVPRAVAGSCCATPSFCSLLVVAARRDHRHGGGVVHRAD